MKEMIKVVDTDGNDISIFTKYIMFIERITKPSYNEVECKWKDEDIGSKIRLIDSMTILTHCNKDEIDRMISD